MKKPTNTQIKKEIAALRKMKPRVLHYSGFGENHHVAIEAVIHVLENKLSASEIYDKNEECEAQECAGEDDIEWHVENIFENAVEAANWLEGETDAIKPSDNWKSLMDLDPATILRPSQGILR